MNRTVLSSLGVTREGKDGYSSSNQTQKRTYLNPFSEALHHNLPDYKSLGIFVTEPVVIQKTYVITPYKGKQIDIVAELKRRGIDFTKQPSNWDQNTAFPSFLDIKHFEDTYLSPLSPEKALDKFAKDPTQAPLALRIYKNAAQFEEITEISFIPSTQLYSVKYSDNKSAQLPQMFVLFPFDDPMSFVDRIERAFHLRRLEEAWFRFNLYIDEIPREDLQTLTPADRTRLLTLVTKLAKFKRFSQSGQKAQFSEALLDEVNAEMQKVSNRLMFSMKVLSSPHLFKGLSLPLPRLPGAVEHIPFPEPTNFKIKDSIKTLESIHLFANDWFANAAPVVVGWCLDIAQTSLFNTAQGQVLTLDSWQRQSRGYERAAIGKAKTKLVSQVSTVIFDVIRNINIPFSLTEFNKQIYLESPLGRFVSFSNRLLESHLRDFLSNSARWLQERLISPDPIFIVSLEVVDGKIEAQPKPERFLTALSDEIEFAFSSFEGFQKLEPSVLKAMVWEPIPVYDLPTSFPFLAETAEKVINSSSSKLNELIESLSSYLSLLETPASSYASTIDGNDIEAIKAALHSLEEEAADLRANFPFRGEAGLFRIDLTSVRKALFVRLYERRAALLSRVIASADERMRAIKGEYIACQTRLGEEPKTIEALISLRDFIEGLPNKLEQIKKKLVEALASLSTVEDNCIAVPDELDSLRWELIGFERKLEGRASEVNSELDTASNRLNRELQCDRMMLTSQASALANQVVAFSQTPPVPGGESQSAARVRAIQSKLDEALAKAELYNSRERLIGETVTDFTSLRETRDQFAPLRDFWEAVATWKASSEKWKTAPLKTLKAQEVETQFASLSQQLNHACRRLSDPALLELGSLTRTEMESFKKMLPVMAVMLNPGMTEKHWQTLKEAVGRDIGLGETTSLQDVVDAGLGEHVSVAQEVSAAASGEFSIATTLKKLEASWEEKTLEIETREGSIKVLVHADILISMLDESVGSLQAIQFSPYKGPFDTVITKWQSTLSSSLSCLEAWLDCQAKLLYLSPVFFSKDIRHQLPGEASRFDKVSEWWLQTLSKSDGASALEVCGNRDLLAEFKKFSGELEGIERALVEYLETKRTAFPRFYFMSNDELLKLLSIATEPSQIQPFLRRCFESMTKISLQGENALGMESGEDEYVPFSRQTLLQGNVEHWMLALEAEMRNTLQRSLEANIEAGPDSLGKIPAQILLAVRQIQWTAETEEAITNGKLADHAAAVHGSLLELAKLTSGNLNPASRTALSSLIVAETHNRDVVQNLNSMNVSDIAQFEWSSQLRHYLVGGLAVIRMVSAEFAYGYEYLGSTSRLVITPLTDRCYLTLTSALQMQMGGAPQGPAGTGKTETTKDLARVVAKQCVVFNCSEGLDYLQMGTFFTGLSSCGAWACFDEFNRIDVEVLSVIAQQIATIQAAIQGRRHHFSFEGREVRLNATCAIFITMNPGYAGRTELPDNLKALFRPVAMMVPDYALIAEISLYSFGFSDARTLAGKVAATFRLASEQLSAQSHYDFGMRAVKTVVSTAGALLSSSKGLTEAQVILKALKDVNVPKLASRDLTLFENIASDLFPGVSDGKVDDGGLSDRLVAVCERLVKPKDSVKKAIELYDTIAIRHGVMLVGPAGCGKTTCYQILSEAMGDVKTVVINPKAVTLGQLYGDFDQHTHDWTDGLLADAVRVAAADETPSQNWIVLDGPVDALWIENMNTVLDDNKKLCLSSSEVIALTPRMRLIFEVEDLRVASPATVSRCGMVYIEPKKGNYEPLLVGIDESIRPSIESEMKYIVIPVLTACEGLRTYLTIHQQSSIVNYLRIRDLVIKEGVPERAASIFAVVWSIGSIVSGDDRVKFDEIFKGILSKLGYEYPTEATLYDYAVDAKGFRMWEVPSRYSDLVPTDETTRYSYIISNALKAGIPVLAVGPTGSGKTVTLRDTLRNSTVLPMTFSAQTTANGVQDLIDGRLERVSTGVFGAPPDRPAIVMIDDLNMPRRDTFGAQPPLELLRQLLSQNGWYDRKKRTFRKLVNVHLAAAMRTPETVEQVPTQRLTRHFLVVGFPDVSPKAAHTIFSSILEPLLQADLIAPLIDSSLSVYSAVVKYLLPTPARPHYAFNLRDIDRVVKGVTSLDPKDLKDRDSVLRIWYHESLRVYSDRLATEEHRDWLIRLVRRTLHESFGVRHFHLAPSEPIQFADFGVDQTRRYQPVTDIEAFTRACQANLDDYNASASQPLDLVLFPEAVQHLVRICRVIREPGGCALLLGVGGSGRQSLTKLAAFICGANLVQPEISRSYGRTEWRADLRRLLFDCGLRQRETVFLVSENQLVDEGFLEDINALLNSGDPPALFDDDDMERIINELGPTARSRGIPPTRSGIYGIFISNVKLTLHVVLSLSPEGSNFRRRVRSFPSLVSCCTIDWYSPWPLEALDSVAKTRVPSDQSLFCANAHITVVNASERFFRELRRTNHATPSTFLNFLDQCQTVTDSLFHKLEGKIGNFRNGLQRMAEASDEIVILEKNIRELQPHLALKREEATRVLEELTADQSKAATMKEQISLAAKEAETQSQLAQQLRDEAQADLDAVAPRIEAALAALARLTRGQIAEIRGVAVATGYMKLIAAAICIVFDEPPKRVQGSKTGDYWDPAKVIMADPNFLLRINQWTDQNKEKIPKEKMAKLMPILENPEFTPEAVYAKNQAAAAICQWIHALKMYYDLNQVVAPKKVKLAEAEEGREKALAAVAESQAKLKEVEDKVAELTKRHSESEAELRALVENEARCKVRLERAGVLTKSLESERDSWRKQLIELESQRESVKGDALLAAASVAYLGPFTGEFRKEIMREWCEAIDKAGIKRTTDRGFVDTLLEPLTILKWHVNSLPRDESSVENAVILTQSKKFPLLIDPEGSAAGFIRSIEPELLVLRTKDKTFVRQLEGAISFGRPVMIEGVGTDIDPSLDPLLTAAGRGKATQIKLEHTVTLNPEFRLYLITSDPNPIFTPEVIAKVTLINFTITPKALADQLLALVVAKEKPNLEKEKETLVVANANTRGQLAEAQERILKLLQGSHGDILDDVELIDALAESNRTATALSESMKQSEETERQIDASRREYEPVARRGTLLYFCITDLRHVAPMYQYSLAWYSQLVGRLLSACPHAPTLQERLTKLSDFITLKIFRNISNSLFARHQLMFGFLIASKILMDQGSIGEDEWKFLLTGTAGTATAEIPPNPLQGKLPDAGWGEIWQLSQIGAFNGIDTEINEETLRSDLLSHKFSKDLEERLTPFRRLCIARCIRPDLLVTGFELVVKETLGEEYLETEPSSISAAFQDAGPTTPIIFILSSGTDPAQDVQNFAAQSGFLEKLRSLSLGQGQGNKASEMIETGRTEGFWVLLQNCHLATSYLPKLEETLQTLREAHPDFRLFLTSMPTPSFPISILQNGVKVTTEPPQGTKATILHLFKSFGQKALKESQREPEFKSLFYSLCVLHAIVLGRRRYGPLGWNTPYEWTRGDLDISRKQLNAFLNPVGDIPFKTLRFLAGEINYGGRVTDDWDRRTLLTIVSDIYREEALSPGFSLAPGFVTPPVMEFQGYLDEISSLPLSDQPSFFGLHPNADINLKQATGFEILSDILATRPRGTTAGSGNAEMVQLVNSLLRKVPQPLDEALIAEKFPSVYSESMNTVLQQEAARFNELLNVVKTSMEMLLKAMKGLIVFTAELEDMATSLEQNQVPANWAAVAYPSLKPLGSWMTDLAERVKFLRDWYDFGQPRAFWISGLFFPQAFLTGTKQNFARKNKIPVDEVSFDFQVLDKGPQRIIRPPSDGVYIYGLHLEAAGYDITRGLLTDQAERQLTQEMPVIWLKPVRKRVPPVSGVYRCPVYKIGTRQGTLTTTGHSSNYVMTIELPTDTEESFWIKRGTALLCSLAR